MGEHHITASSTGTSIFYLGSKIFILFNSEILAQNSCSILAQYLTLLLYEQIDIVSRPLEIIDMIFRPIEILALSVNPVDQPLTTLGIIGLGLKLMPAPWL